MNARQMGMALVVAGSLVVGVSAVAAQSGNGRGPGPGTGDCPAGQTCTQMQAGTGFGVGSENCPMGGDCAQLQTQAGNSNGQGGRWANSNATTNPGQGGRFAVQSGPMTDDVAAAMTAGWLDEVQAEAAYTQLIAQFGEVVPFVALQRAEAQHAAAWARQFERFGLTLPEATAAELPEFASVAEACAAAITIEEDNIGLYDDMLATFEGYPSLTRVATALREASLNRHLPTLEACAG